MHRLTYCIKMALCLLFIGLSGCAQLNHHNTQMNTLHTAQYYAELAETAPNELKMAYQLQAGQAFLQAGRFYLAKQNLKHIDADQLNQNERIDYTLALAHLELLDRRPHHSLHQLRKLNRVTLLPAQQIEFYQLRAQAFKKSNRPLTSIKARIALQPLLESSAAQLANQQQIWNAIQALPLPLLVKTNNNTHSTKFKAWVQLAIIAKTDAKDPPALIQNLLAWQQRYPDHAANTLLPPAQLQTAKLSLTDPVEHIALLLPLTGSFAKQGNAIKNGFMAAYYQARPKHLSPLKIDIFDTNKQSPEQSYQQAVANGAAFVIGPLRKDHLTDFVDNTRITTPVLLLNYPSDNSRLQRSVYAFGLSPIDEVNQMVETMRQNGHQRTLLLYPDSDWGRRLATQYQTAFTSAGGEISETVEFNPKHNRHYAKTIATLLRVDQSTDRKNQLAKTLHKKLQFTPRIRQDSDAVFLIASPKDARQIKPLLKFYYANNLTVYSPSIIYRGDANPRLDRDLNGIIFCGMPWLISPSHADKQLQASLKALWPLSYKHHPRLYAFGVDTYHLVAEGQLNLLTVLNRFGVLGATGQLTLDDQQQLHRHLQLAEMTRGHATPLL